MIGVVMAGGQATRLNRRVEKALLEVGWRTLLGRASDALSADGIDEIVVAVTHWTPKTKAVAEGLKLRTVETSGSGYHEDTLELLKEFGNYVSLNVDVPFIDTQHVERLVRHVRSESLAAVVPASMALKDPDDESLGVDDQGNAIVWVGLNYVTSQPKTGFLVYQDPLLTLNINTEDDLSLVRAIAAQRNG